MDIRTRRRPFASANEPGLCLDACENSNHRSRDMLALVSSAYCPLHDEPLPCEVRCANCDHQCWDHIGEPRYPCRVQGCNCRRAMYRGRSYIVWADGSIPDSDYANVNEAADAIRRTMGWAEVHISVFCDGACVFFLWAAYATAEEQMANDSGNAPWIYEW